MAHTLSAKKRIRQNEKRRMRNRALKSRFRTFRKKIMAYIKKGEIEEAKKLLPIFYKAVDKAAKVGTIHKNTASRYKARVAAQINKASKQQAEKK